MAALRAMLCLDAVDWVSTHFFAGAVCDSLSTEAFLFDLA